MLLSVGPLAAIHTPRCSLGNTSQQGFAQASRCNPSTLFLNGWVEVALAFGMTKIELGTFCPEGLHRGQRLIVSLRPRASKRLASVKTCHTPDQDKDERFHNVRRVHYPALSP